MARLAYTVTMPHFFPRKMKPSTMRITFTMNINVPTSMFATSHDPIIAIPLTPPIAKWFGVLKKLIPAAVRINPRFNSKKYFTLFHMANAPLNRFYTVVSQYTLCSGSITVFVFKFLHTCGTFYE